MNSSAFEQSPNKALVGNIDEEDKNKSATTDNASCRRRSASFADDVKVHYIPRLPKSLFYSNEELDNMKTDAALEHFSSPTMTTEPSSPVNRDKRKVRRSFEGTGTGGGRVRPPRDRCYDAGRSIITPTTSQQCKALLSPDSTRRKVGGGRARVAGGGRRSRPTRQNAKAIVEAVNITGLARFSSPPDLTSDEISTRSSTSSMSSSATLIPISPPESPSPCVMGNKDKYVLQVSPPLH